jgi:hypothetical protein
MSSKFEIINDKWIRNLQTEPDDYSLGKTVKLSSIHSFTSYDADEKGFEEGRVIMLLFGGQGVKFFYKKNEKAEYESDLKFLENILFNQ